jgi:short-subunit dehydrogenase
MGVFSGRTVLITGASSGIGAALALEWARQGADVALAARRVDRLDALARDCQAVGARAVVIPCDVTRDGDCEQAVARTRSALGRIDVVVANAGFGVMGAFEKLALEDYRRQFETNVFGVLRTAHASLAELTATRGRLVVIGSVSGHVASPGASAYAMSKFAVRALSEALRAEWRGRGVSVTLITPGFVDSEIHQVDNRGVHHPDSPDFVPRWLRMPTDRAARLIVRAAARRRREVVITGHGKVAVFLKRHVPWLVATGIERLGIQSRREATGAASTNPQRTRSS